MNNYLLSICIPIYNREKYLKKTLSRFLNDKNLFSDKIQLYISDNCSEDDLESVCMKYQDKGLNLTYHRNKTNLGMDYNFINCIKNAKGKYLLLLGSDDLPRNDFFSIILPILEREEYSLIHLHESNNQQQMEYINFPDFLLRLNGWITFISSNIVKTNYINKIDFSKYIGTMLSQVPLYLYSASLGGKNMILCGSFFQEGDDSKHNSGYNIFQVFIVNLLGMIKPLVEKDIITKHDYYDFKRLLFKNLLAGEVNRRLLFHVNDRLCVKGGWKILMAFYGKYSYMYYYMIVELYNTLKRKF